MRLDCANVASHGSSYVAENPALGRSSREVVGSLHMFEQGSTLFAARAVDVLHTAAVAKRRKVVGTRIGAKGPEGCTDAAVERSADCSSETAQQKWIAVESRGSSNSRRNTDMDLPGHSLHLFEPLAGCIHSGYTAEAGIAGWKHNAAGCIAG